MSSRAKAILWILGVFVTGGLFGGTVAYVAVRSASIPTEVAEPVDSRGDDSAPPQSAGPPSEPGEEPRTLRQDSPRAQNRAQDHRPSRPGTTEDLRRMSRYLNLDAGQRQELRRIIGDSRTRMQLVDQELGARRQQIRGDMLRSIRSILRPDQKERFDEFIRRRSAQPKHRRPTDSPRPSDARPPQR